MLQECTVVLVPVRKKKATPQKKPFVCGREVTARAYRDPRTTHSLFIGPTVINRKNRRRQRTEESHVMRLAREGSKDARSGPTCHTTRRRHPRQKSMPPAWQSAFCSLLPSWPPATATCRPLCPASPKHTTVTRTPPQASARTVPAPQHPSTLPAYV